VSTNGKGNWVRGLRDQVRAAGAKLFVKQIGSIHALWPRVTGKGEDRAQWPADLRVQNFPQWSPFCSSCGALWRRTVFGRHSPTQRRRRRRPR